MTSNNQVSPVIRISRGERDASARATHLKAASKKYLETTIERKQMSTTTNFKRIALVAVAALGLGVLSSVPSKAAINADSVTLSSATAAQTTAETFTATSAVATVSFFGAKNDSITVTASLVSAPVANTSLPVLRLVETTSAWVDSATSVAPSVVGTPVTANTAAKVSAASSAAATSAKFAIYLSSSGTTDAPLIAGTYVVRITPLAGTGGALIGSSVQNLTITVTTAATQDKNSSAANSTVFIVGTNNDAKIATADSTIVALKTAGSTNAAMVANLAATQLNAAKAAASESLTVTISGAGVLGSHGTLGSVVPSGRSLSVKQNDYVGVFPDGASGVGTITVTGSTSGVLLATKTVTFSDVAATKYATPTIASTDSSVIAVGGTTRVSVLAQDASSNLVSGLVGGTDYWAYSSNTAIATVATYSFSSTTGYGIIVTGVAAGEAEISFGNASTLAAATIKSAPIKVRVGTAVPNSVTVTLDKSTYAPGEKMTMTVTILNAAGLPVVGATAYNNIFSSTGVTSSVNLSGTSTLPSTNIADYSNTTNTKTFTLYAPVTGGPVVFSWTGGTGLAAAERVAKTVSVTVTDSGAAALAAVTALATTVASLRTLIVTLTNLVLKIQKKVRA
jgi:trimeric autotransporter adhesin